MRPEDGMVDPVFHNESFPSKPYEEPADGSLMFKFVLFFEVIEHGFREGSNEECEYFLERNHNAITNKN